jgi:ribosomal protein L11 methyltransferase
VLRSIDLDRTLFVHIGHSVKTGHTTRGDESHYPFTVVDVDERWFEVAIEADPAEADELAGALWAAGAAGIEERTGEAGMVGLGVAVPERALSSIRHVLRGRAVAVAQIDPDAALDEWRRYAKPVDVGDITVRPAWLGPTEMSPSIDVIIEPGRAFGIGSHESTRLCLAALASLRLSGATVLDVGTGTGVLAVASALLGAAAVTAIDIDPEAVLVAADNVRRNGVDGVVQVSTTPVARIGGRYDLVVANLTAQTLIEIAPAVLAAVESSGHLVLSGVLVDQEADVSAAYSPLRLVELRDEGEWAALVLTR